MVDKNLLISTSTSAERKIIKSPGTGQKSLSLKQAQKLSSGPCNQDMICSAFSANQNFANVCWPDASDSYTEKGMGRRHGRGTHICGSKHHSRHLKLRCHYSELRRRKLRSQRSRNMLTAKEILKCRSISWISKIFL